MPPGADGPLLGDLQTPNPFFGYINQTCNRRGTRGIEPIGGKMWLRELTDLGAKGFSFGLFMYLMQQSTANNYAMYGGPVEVYNYPTILKIDLANKDDEAPAYMELGEVIDTPYVRARAAREAYIDDITGEEVPAVEAVEEQEATYRPARYSDMPGAMEHEGFLYVTNADLRSGYYMKGSVCLQLMAEPGVTVVGLSDYPVIEIVEEIAPDPEPEPEPEPDPEPTPDPEPEP